MKALFAAALIFLSPAQAIAWKSHAPSAMSLLIHIRTAWLCHIDVTDFEKGDLQFVYENIGRAAALKAIDEIDAIFNEMVDRDKEEACAIIRRKIIFK